MLPRSNRLTNRRDFDRVYARGRQYRGPFVGVYALAKPGGPVRIGISASKKVGGAVERNRAKRRLREVCRKALPTVPGAFDVVLVARTAVLESEFDQLTRSIAELLEKAGRESQTPRRENRSWRERTKGRSQRQPNPES